MQTFIPESDLTDLTPAEIEAGERTGLLVPWRRDATGELWYRRRDSVRAVPRGTQRTIRAVPVEYQGGDDDGDD